MKTAARIISYLFHPLLMPTLGLFLILHSGSYLSLMDPMAKHAILLVMVLGTLVFPLMMIPILHYRQLVSMQQGGRSYERLLPGLVILILYAITWIYFSRLPLNRSIQAYMLAVLLTLMVMLALNLRFRVSMHLAALGGLCGLILALAVLYDALMQGPLILIILASGLSASAQILMNHLSWKGVLGGFVCGSLMVFLILLIY